MAKSFDRSNIETGELSPTDKILPDGGSNHAVFSKMGFAWGKVCAQDPLFREVRLPMYWSLRATDDPVKWVVIDRWGTSRAEVLYRNAPGNRVARIIPLKRFSVRVDTRQGNVTGVALDRGAAMYRSKPFKSSAMAVKEAEKWLDEHFSGWRSFTSDVNSVPT